MKKIIFVAMVAFSGFVNAQSCEANASKFASMLNNMHKLGMTPQSAENQFRNTPQIADIAVKYMRVLNTAPKGGWTTNEYEMFSRRFVKGACN